MIRIYFIFTFSTLMFSQTGQSTVLPKITNTMTEIKYPLNKSVSCGCNSLLKDCFNEEEIQKEAKYGILHFSLQFESAISKISENNKNILFAPVSVLGILATLLLGAVSKTKYEILNLLGFSTDNDYMNRESGIHKVLENLFANFTSESDGNLATKIKLNQAIFFQNGTFIEDGFRKSAQQYYKNKFINVNFSDSNQGAKDLINSWISNRTDGRIQEVIKSPLSANTKLIILNTLFFDGEWEQPFSINSTWEDFYGTNTTMKVKMMSNFGTVYVYEDSARNFTVLGLPYKGGNTVMYIIYPVKQHDLKTVLSVLNKRDLYDIVHNARKEEDVTYSIPYMNLNEQIDLKSVLQSLGVQSIFDSSKANFSKINKDVFVGEALHSVNLDITEAGSTGAASTSVNIETKFPKKTISINKPFSFYIIHQPSGIVSFWGTINEPVCNEKNNIK